MRISCDLGDRVKVDSLAYARLAPIVGLIAQWTAILVRGKSGHSDEWRIRIKMALYLFSRLGLDIFLDGIVVNNFFTAVNR